MRRNLVLFAVLLFASLNALGQSRRPARFANPLLDDVVQMSRAQLPEATILAFVRARQARLESDVTADDLIRLHRAGVSDRVVGYIAGVSGLENRPSVRDRGPEAAYDSGGYSTSPVEREDEDGEIEAYPEPYGAVYDGWGWGWGEYPYWYDYSPFFYGGVVIRGGGGFHHRGFDHHGGGRHDHGGNHSGHGGGSHGGGGGHHGGGSHGGGGHGHR